VTLTDTDPLRPAAGTVATTTIIERPDRVSVTQTIDGRPSTLVSIGSKAYEEFVPGEWTVLHRATGPRFYNAALLFLRVMEKASAVTRHGNTYDIPTPEALHLVKMSQLTKLNAHSSVRLWAVIKKGRLKSMTVVNTGDPNSELTETVSHLGTSARITAPPLSDVIQSPS
jgi:hypothetical protein